MEEVWTEGRRMLAFQDATHEAELRRAGELLRLNVVTLGGLIIVAGILTTAKVAVGWVMFSALFVGVVALVGSSFLLSMVMTVSGGPRGFAYGPDLGLLVAQLAVERLTRPVLLLSLIEGLPGWVADNERMLARVHRRKAIALMAMVAGATLLLLALLYIARGAIVA